MHSDIPQIVQQIVAIEVEEILRDPNRLIALFAARQLDKPEWRRAAFGRRSDAGRNPRLTVVSSAGERKRELGVLLAQLHAATGIDHQRSADALDLVRAMVLGARTAQAHASCPHCGKQLTEADGVSAHEGCVPMVMGGDRVSVSPCGMHAMVLRKDGTLWAWGENTVGQLGDGTTTNCSAPVQIGETGEWASVSAGYRRTVAIKRDGTLWAWGENRVGQLGDGTTIERHAPVQIGRARDWVFVVASVWYAMALKRDGTMWVWGCNNFVPLDGDSEPMNRSVPVQMSGVKDLVFASAGFGNGFGITKDGMLLGNGQNVYGQVGDGTTTDRSEPVRVGKGIDWASVSAGFTHTAGIGRDGTLWAWGRNDMGQLGDGTKFERHLPIQVGREADWVFVSAGKSHTVGMRKDGTIWAWGSNNQGQLGDGTRNGRNAPVRIGERTQWLSVSAGDECTVAIGKDGVIWSWGRSEVGIRARLGVLS